jgi:hypothetical protein
VNALLKIQPVRFHQLGRQYLFELVVWRVGEIAQDVQQVRHGLTPLYRQPMHKHEYLKDCQQCVLLFEYFVETPYLHSYLEQLVKLLQLESNPTLFLQIPFDRSSQLLFLPFEHDSSAYIGLFLIYER